MRVRAAAVLLTISTLLVAGCGIAKRAALAGVLAMQSNAVLTQSTFDGQPERLHKRCEGILSARLNFADAFSQAMTSVNSTSESSSKNVRSLAKSSSDTSRPVIVIQSAYSSAMRSFSPKSGEVAYSFKVINFSSLKPSSLPTAALMSCQNSQPFKKATRRLTIACILESIKPEESSPLHMPRTARKIDGRRA